MLPSEYKPDAPGAIATATEIQSARGLAHSKSFAHALAFWSAAVLCRFSAQTRSLEPEWLDEMQAGDPRAVRSRRDLVRVNSWMLNCRTIASVLRTAPPRRIVDLAPADRKMMLPVPRL